VISGLLFLLAEREIEEMQQQRQEVVMDLAAAEAHRGTSAAAPVLVEADMVRVK